MLMNLDYNISNRMSVSLSSFYEQTPALRVIQEKIQKSLLYEQSMKSTIRQIVVQACEISMPQCYRLLAILAKSLKSSNSILHKFAILLLSKQLFLTALHHFYIFGSIKIIPWVKSIASFQTRKKMPERVRLYLQQISLKGNGDEVVQQRYCFKLLGFVDQFLPWFSLNFPYHINALFEFSSTFKKNLSSLPISSTPQFFQYFSDRDFEKFEKNFNILKCQSSLQLKEMCDFIGLEVRSVVDQQKQKSQLLKEAVRTADSYCIRTIISEMTTLLQDTTKLITCVKLIDFLVVQGEIQFNELVKIYCLPILLEYILPINFSNVNGSRKRVETPPRRCSPLQQKTIVDCIYKWAKICEQLNLPVGLYVVVMRLMQNAGKPIKRKHYSDYLTNVIQMHQTNNQKRSQIQNPQIQKQLIGIVESRGGTHKESRSVEKHPILWKSNISAINELQDFQESRVNFGKKIENKSIFWKSKVSHVGDRRIPNNDSFNNFFKSQVTTSKPIENDPITDNCMSIEIISKKTPHKIFSGYREDSFHPSKLSESETPKYIEIQKSNQLDSQQISQQRSGRSSFKPKQGVNNQGKQKMNGQSVSSYVPFEASKMSEFSELSVKRSNQNNAALAEYYKKNDKEVVKSREKSQLKGSKSKLRSSKQSKSESIIYFNNSHEFHSESRIKIYKNSQKNTQNKKLLDFEEPNDQNPSVGTEEYFVRALNPIKTSTPEKVLKNSDSLSRSKSSQPNVTIYFKNSIHSKQNNDDSLGSSKLTQYGIQGNYLPEPTKKPKFGFKKTNNAEIRESNANNQFLGSEAFTNFQYTGNRHAFNIGENILSSQGSELAFSTNNFNRTGHILGGGRIMMNSEKEISEIQKKKAQKNLKLKNTDKFYDVQVRMPKVKEKSEYGESSSEIKDEVFKKYKLSESRQFNINTLSKGSEAYENDYKLQKKYRSPDKFIIQQYENDKLLDLQKEVGKARRAKQEKERQLKEKEQQYKKIREQAEANSKNRQKINNLKKQNQILQLLTLQKNQEEYEGSYNADGVIKPIKNQIRIEDYFLVNEVKGLYSPYTQTFERIFIKQLLGSRCLLIKNQYMELGYNYSQRGNEISLYLTLVKAYDEVSIKVTQNSILMNEDVDITMHDVPARNQLKIKRKVKGILEKKKDPTFSEIIHQNPSQIIVYPQIYIGLSQHGDRLDQFTARIPCSIFNLAVPVQIDSEQIRPLQNKKVIKSPQMRLSDEFLRNPKQKMSKYFPYSVDLSEGWCLIGYEYKEQIFGKKSPDFIKYRIQGMKIEFEFFGDPKNPLIETLVCMLVGSQTD